MTAATAFEPVTSTDEVGELLAHALADDIDCAFEQVVRTYQDRIVSMLTRDLSDAQRAEEIAQDVFVRAYRALQTYDRPRIRSLRLRAWLYTIALNLLRNAVRGKRLRVVGLDHHDGRPRAIADRSPSPETQAELSDDLQRVNAAIRKLSPRIKSAFVLRYIEELSYDEIAETLAQPLGTVKASAHRGLMAVRAALENDR